MSLQMLEYSQKRPIPLVHSLSERVKDRNNSPLEGPHKAFIPFYWRKYLILYQLNISHGNG